MNVITIILILLFLYVVLGVSRIISDFNQPSINQPHYVHHLSITGILFAFLLSPFFWWAEVTDPMPKGTKMRNKELKKLERKNKKLMRDIFRK
ncbi:MAG: hypothetical protein KAU58_02115 [Candidatus Omnitrophica bacterium]|nr:hypothetical protein [Candidatus Omnitrophota bacterium]